MTEVKITGITRPSRVRTSKQGMTLIAYFNARWNGVLFKGCSIRRFADDTIVAMPPRVDTDTEAGRTCVKFEGAEVREGMLRAALEAFTAIGGTEEELQGRPRLPRQIGVDGWPVE